MAEGEGGLPEFIEDKSKKHHRPAIVKVAMTKFIKNKGNCKTPPAPQTQAWTDLEMKGPQTSPEAASTSVHGDEYK